jgi:hypothetical protein
MKSLRALKSDCNESFLFNRLEAYTALGRGLAEFSTEPIILVGGQPLAPGTLTFPSTTNWWGTWKTALETTPDVPRRVTLLKEVGVVHQSLTESLSRAFFEWLAGYRELKSLSLRDRRRTFPLLLMARAR